MGKRDNFDFNTLAALLTAWENASLSQEDRYHLDNLISAVKSNTIMRQEFASEYPDAEDVLDLYINLEEAASEALTSYVSDTDYDSFITDADNFIGRLALNDERRKPRKWRRILISMSAAAVLISFFITAVLRNLPDSGTRNSTIKEAIACAPEENSESIKVDEPNIHELGNLSDSGISPKAIKIPHKSYAVEQKHEPSTADIHDDSATGAWLKFMDMRAEMAEVVQPGNLQAVCTDFPYIGTPDILNDDENLSIDVYRSLEEAGEMFKSILCDL